MGAVPKTRITGVNRRKRRRGNRPQLRKDPNVSSVPHHKRGLVAQMKRMMGMVASKQS